MIRGYLNAMRKRTREPELDDVINHELMALGDAEFYRTAPPDECRSRWAALFRWAGGEDSLPDVGAQAVAWLLSYGWNYAMQARDYAEAVRLTELFFQHPDQEQADLTN